MLLTNKTAVITGCNKGIGKSILEEFSKNGANIFACVRRLDDEFNSLIEIIKKENKNEIIPIEIDLSDQNQVKEAGKKILSHDKSIDILINNAGLISTSLFQMTPIEKYKELFDVNFYSQILFTQLILKSMTKIKKGNIVFISSSSGLDGNEGRSAYVASKAAIIGQAKVLSRELGKYNIKVNTIAPGLTDTDMMQKNTPKKIIDDVVSQLSLKRVAEPKEIANIALFLSSYLSDYVTGQVIRVDGGM
jgi:3-oxoacyl-[acyl-carrier protein] reductase